MMSVTQFYNDLTPFYHLIFEDWDQSIARQAASLDSVIQEVWGAPINTILDAACGIGTQTFALADRGYQVAGSDLSPKAIERAGLEAAKRGLAIDFSVADMRLVYSRHRRQFDLVIAGDNAIPHLLTDEDILEAFRQFYACLRPGGGVLLTVRDYDQMERGGCQVKPYGLRVENGIRYLAFQVWEFHDDLYNLSMYFIADDCSTCTTHVMRTEYYAVSIERLLYLMKEAGFVEVKRLDERFYQPILIGTRPSCSRR